MLKLLSCLLLASTCQPPPQPLTPPSALVIVADDLGIEHVAPWGVGSDFAPAPRIASLASQGVRFDSLWASPVCSPTRAGLLTGQYALRHGVGSAVQGPGDRGLPLGAETIAEALSDVPTSIFGKWHLGVEAAEGGEAAPNAQGFDYAVVTDANLTPVGETYSEWTWRRNGVSEVGQGYLTSATVDEAVQWIGAQTTGWVSYVWFHAPHGPAHCPPDELITQPCDAGDVLSQYHAMTEAMDTEVSRLLDSIDLSNTLVIFISDNGSAPVIALPPFDPDRTKRTVYEGGVRVPGAMWYEGITPGVATAPYVVQDIPATVAEWVKGATFGRDGASWLPLGSDDSHAAHPFVLTEIFDPNGDGPYDTVQRAARDERYKLISSGGNEEFYDLWDDPYEENDIRHSMTWEQLEAYYFIRGWVLSLPD